MAELTRRRSDGQPPAVCGGCAHWTAIADLPYPGWGPRSLNLPDNTEDRAAVFNREVGRCSKIEMSEESMSSLEDVPLAWTEDGSMYRADLYTRSGFGCVLHEAKP